MSNRTKKKGAKLGVKAAQVAALRTGRSVAPVKAKGAKGDRDARIIGDLWRKACTSAVDSMKYSIECGQALIAKKDSLKHGEWLPWLEANADVLGFETRRTASALMKAAQDARANGKLTSHLNEADAASFMRHVWGNDNVRGTQGTGENEWYTPGPVLDLAREVLGGIDVDPASSQIAQQAVGAVAYFTKEDDGLTKPWEGTVWLNPPYAQPFIEHFADKMVAEVQAGRVKAAVMLTHNYTDTTWFHKLASVANAICFPRSRIKFEDPEGNKAAPTQGQALFYFGGDVARFAQAFGAIGFIGVPWGRS